MNDNIFSSLLGFVLSLILFFFIKKVMKLDRGPSSVITFILIVPILFFYTKDIKMLIGFSDSEIRVTDGFKPVKVYNKLKISNFTFKQIYIEKEITNYGYGVEDGGSELFTINGEKIEYSTINPIKTNEEFICVGKIGLDKNGFNELTTREYE